MKSSLLNKKLVALSTSVFLAVGLAIVPTTAQAAMDCANLDGVKTCSGATSDGAKYVMMIPDKYNGTMFLYSHGYRYNQDVPPVNYTVASVTNNPLPTPTPVSPTDLTVAQYLLAKGYAVAGSAYATQGWNAEAAVATNVELINTFKKNFKTKKVVAWGESLGGFISQALAEQYPELVSAAGLICPALGDVRAELGAAGDALWGLKTFFDPTIKGQGYSHGAAGDMEALQDLGKIAAVGSALKVAIATGQWPASSGAAGKALAAIPPRSALLMIALMAGIPLKSAHFDGVTGPGAPTSSAYTSFATAAQPAFAALENIGAVAALAVLGTRDVEAQVGGAFFDNSDTDYAKRVAEDAVTYNAALSGNSAIKGMLSFISPLNPAAPRFKANPLGKEELSWFMSNTGQVNVPTLVIHGTSDPAVPAGNTQWLVDRYNKSRAKGAKQMLTVFWNHAPESYTKFTATGLPDASGPAATGTNHYNFTNTQIVAFAEALMEVAKSGNTKPTKNMKRMAGIAQSEIDPGYRPPLLPYYAN